MSEIAELLMALEESVKLQGHYARLLNDYDGGERIVFRDIQHWMDCLREIGKLPLNLKVPK